MTPPLRRRNVCGGLFYCRDGRTGRFAGDDLRPPGPAAQRLRSRLVTSGRATVAQARTRYVVGRSIRTRFPPRQRFVQPHTVLPLPRPAPRTAAEGEEHLHALNEPCQPVAVPGPRADRAPRLTVVGVEPSAFRTSHSQHLSHGHRASGGTFCLGMGGNAAGCRLSGVGRCGPGRSGPGGSVAGEGGRPQLLPAL